VELLKGRSLDQTYMKNYLIKIKINFGFIIDESIKCFLSIIRSMVTWCTTSKCEFHDYKNTIAIESNPLFITYL